MKISLLSVSSTRRLRLARRLALLGAVGLSAIAVSATSNDWRLRSPAARSLIRSFAAEPLAADALRPSERVFLTKAAESTRQQMRLAEIGASQSESAEVRSHATQLAADYRALNDTIEALIRRKGSVAGDPVGTTSQNYASLMEKSGNAFDREFVRTVANSSNDVMTLFESAASDAKDADVRDLAASELPILRAHRNAVEGLKKTFD